jgi:hypothetical protein
MSAQTTQQAPAIELIVEQDKEGQVAANVPLRWKISPEMAQNLAQKGVEPFMLLIIANDGYETDRYLVPLKVGMTFLQMRRPGTGTIYATIVWQKDGEDSVKKIVLRKDDYGNYMFEPLRWFKPGLAAVERRLDELIEIVRLHDTDEESTALASLKSERKQLRAQLEILLNQEEVFGLFDGFRAIERSTESDQINIEVPEAMFAADPPRWMTWLGTFYKWPRKAQDQCDLRRRALLTAASLPFVVPIVVVLGVIVGAGWLAFKLVAVLVTAVLLFFGVRNLDYSVIYEWDNFELGDIWRYTEPSFWLYKKVIVEVEQPHANHSYTVTKYEPRNLAFTWISPPVLVFFVSLQLILNGFAMSSLLYGIGFPVVLALLTPFFAKWLKRRKAGASKESVITEEKRSKLEHELILLTAGGSAKLSDLPTGQRTVRLRYLNLKATVCKPFAR